MLAPESTLPPTAQPPVFDPALNFPSKSAESLTMSSDEPPSVVHTGYAVAVEEPTPVEADEPELEPKEDDATSSSGDEGEFSDEPKSNLIITLKPETTTEELDKYEKRLKKQGGVIKHKYNSIILKGFAVALPESRVQTFSDDPSVQYVEPDGDMHI